MIDEFWFTDINYPTGLRLTPALDGRAGVNLKTKKASATDLGGKTLAFLHCPGRGSNPQPSASEVSELLSFLSPETLFTA